MFSKRLSVGRSRYRTDQPGLNRGTSHEVTKAKSTHTTIRWRKDDVMMMRKTLEVPTPNENNATNIFYRQLLAYKLCHLSSSRYSIYIILYIVYNILNLVLERWESLCFKSVSKDNLWSWLETGWNYWIWWYCKVIFSFMWLGDANIGSFVTNTDGKWPLEL